MKLALVAITALAGLGPARSAAAFSACNGMDRWAPDATDELPPHAHIVYASDRGGNMPKTLTATIDGKVVRTKLTTYDVKPYQFVLVEIDSAATGALVVEWDKAPGRRRFASASYTIVAKPSYPKLVHGKTERFHRKLGHSTVREVFDGLQITVDAPVVLAHVKLRRDAKALWNEFDVPITDGRTIKIGELGCVANYTVDLLEKGVDVDIMVTLPDNTQLPIADLKHATIPKLAKPTSDNPGDSE